MHDGYSATRRARTSVLTNGRFAVMSMRRASTTLSKSPAAMRSTASATDSFHSACGHRRGQGELVGRLAGGRRPGAAGPTAPAALTGEAPVAQAASVRRRPPAS